MEEEAGRSDRCKIHLVLQLDSGSFQYSHRRRKFRTEHDKLVLPNHKLQGGSTIPPEFHSEPIKLGLGIDRWRQTFSSLVTWPPSPSSPHHLQGFKDLQRGPEGEQQKAS